jgi:hypothetical protein
MRKILAVGCGALHLAFGFLAGHAHVHRSADPHGESRGLHLDHGHVSDGHDGDRRHDHHHEGGSGGAAHDEGRFQGRHADHHGGDAVYLSETPVRSVDWSGRTMPAIASVGALIDPPSSASDRNDTAMGKPRDPPRGAPSRLRAPPA